MPLSSQRRALELHVNIMVVFYSKDIFYKTFSSFAPVL